MRGVIFTGGRLPDAELAMPLIEPFSFSIAADSGLLFAKRAGIDPDLVVGDMDSLPDRSLLDAYPAERKMVWPVDKDDTDTELAIAEMVARGIDDIALVGGGGGRIDHFLGIRILFERDSFPSLWIGDESVVVAVGDRAASRAVRVVGLEGQASELGVDPVSVFPAGKGAHSCRGTGFHWPIDSLGWDSGAISLSNRADTGSVSIIADSGLFLVVFPLKRGIRVEREAARP
jgi:thiamine pyrophosphokinase